MMKHVQLSPYRARADTVSLSSTTSYNSLGPESLGSRSSSYTSLTNEISTQNTTVTTIIIKIYAKCLRPDIEYKTLSVTSRTTCRDVINTLLGKYKMKHRDPKLFYLSMEVMVRKAGVRTSLALDDEARPAVLQSCHPKGDSRISLQMRRGGLVKVHDAVINQNSHYKSLLISARTTADDLLTLLLNCSGSLERVEQFALYEVDPDREQQRKLHPDDRPLPVQQSWTVQQQNCYFLVRRNIIECLVVPRRKFLFRTMAENTNTKPTTTNLLNQTKKKTLSEGKIKDCLLKSTDLKIFPTVPNTGNISKIPFVDYENYFYI